MQPLVETAYAKINLALHIRSRRTDGYHNLETLFAFVDAGDQLTASDADDLTLSISGPFAEKLQSERNNLVLRTAHLMRQHFRVQTGAILTLEKNLPVSSGIGGGSADAAATARLLNRLWGLGAMDSELESLLAPLGADIPACIGSKTVFGLGTGTELTPVSADEFAGMSILLVNPRKPVSTAAVFSRWDGVDRGALSAGRPMATMLQGRNDLEPMAIAICPDIEEILAALRETLPLMARMSGSGATCFAVYQSMDARDAAQSTMNAAWWTLAGKLR